MSAGFDAQQLAREAALHRMAWGNGRIVWRIWGAGRPLVLLHGGSGSWNHWVANIGALVAAGRQVLVPDMPGFGDSDLPAGAADADALVAPLVAGIRQLLPAGAVEVAGFSLGGLVATLMAAQEPGLVARLVLVGAPVVRLPQRTVALRSWAHLAGEEERHAVHRYNLRSLMLVREASLDDALIARHAGNVERDRLRARSLTRTDIMARTLPLLDCPVSAIYGDQDALYVQRWREVEAALATVPRYLGIDYIRSAGHWVQYEASSEFDQILARQLDTGA